MRMVLPVRREDLTDLDIDDAYPWPDSQPWVRANMVATADGAATSPTGESRGISSDADRRVFARLRGLCDAVVVGAGTARAEGYRPIRPKPEFADRRAAADKSPAPAVVLVSRSLDLDLSLPLFTDATTRTVVATTTASDASLRSRTAEVADVLVVGDDDVDPVRLVDSLNERGLRHLAGASTGDGVAAGDEVAAGDDVAAGAGAAASRDGAGATGTGAGCGTGAGSAGMGSAATAPAAGDCMAPRSSARGFGAMARGSGPGTTDRHPTMPRTPAARTRKTRRSAFMVWASVTRRA